MDILYYTSMYSHWYSIMPEFQKLLPLWHGAIHRKLHTHLVHHNLRSHVEWLYTQTYESITNCSSDGPGTQWDWPNHGLMGNWALSTVITVSFTTTPTFSFDNTATVVLLMRGISSRKLALSTNLYINTKGFRIRTGTCIGMGILQTWKQIPLPTHQTGFLNMLLARSIIISCLLERLTSMCNWKWLVLQYLWYWVWSLSMRNWQSNMTYNSKIM